VDLRGLLELLVDAVSALLELAGDAPDLWLQRRAP
jgi:hypothetical protein